MTTAINILDTQLQPSILEIPVPDIIACISSLENVVNHCEQCYEWRTNVFVDVPPFTSMNMSNTKEEDKEKGKERNNEEPKTEDKEQKQEQKDKPEIETETEIETERERETEKEQQEDHFDSSSIKAAMAHFREAAALAPRFTEVSCRGISQLSSSDAQHIQRVGAEVVCKSYQLLENRIVALLEAVKSCLPQLSGRLRIGADITIRRTTREQHGTPASYEKHNPSAVHSDSHDGTLFGFGLVSTKLGTPTYPQAIFPEPIRMFISQSKTGRNNAHQLEVDTLGPRRPWVPATLVVMPACVAHSKPNQDQIDHDETPEIPRWFCRVTLRILIPDLWKRNGRTKDAREERLSLSILVAKHVWNDAVFAEAAQLQLLSAAKVFSGRRRQKQKHTSGTKLTRKQKQQLMALDQGDYTGEYKQVTAPQLEPQLESQLEGTSPPVVLRVRHGYGRCVYKNECIYEGEWQNGVKDGIGIMLMKKGREYKGSWEKGLKHGVGTYLFHNGNTYTGEFIHGLPKDQEGLDAARDGKL